MTPTQRRALHPAAVVEAWEWVDVYCPHYATQGRDWQTTDNMSFTAGRGHGTKKSRSLLTANGCISHGRSLPFLPVGANPRTAPGVNHATMDGHHRNNPTRHPRGRYHHLRDRSARGLVISR